MFQKQLDTKEGRVGKGLYQTLDLDELVKKTGVPVEIVTKVTTKGILPPIHKRGTLETLY